MDWSSVRELLLLVDPITPFALRMVLSSDGTRLQGSEEVFAGVHMMVPTASLS